MGVASAGLRARLAIVLLISDIASLTPLPASQTHPAAIDAHPVGTSVTTIIEFGEQYLGSELYDARITVLEVVRGEKAREIIRQANASNPAPKAGFDYVLARVKFQFSARTSPASDDYNLNETQFTATDSEGREFTASGLTAYPQPRLNGILKPGNRLEGWLVFLVPHRLSKPLMVFREDVGEVSHRGGGTWFELFIRAHAAPSAK